MDPDFWIGYVMLGQAYEQLGRNDLALDAVTIAARLSDHNSKPMSLRGYLLAKTGRSHEARELLAALETTSHLQYVPPFALALVHAGLGEREAVFEWARPRGSSPQRRTGSPQSGGHGDAGRRC